MRRSKARFWKPLVGGAVYAGQMEACAASSCSPQSRIPRLAHSQVGTRFHLSTYVAPARIAGSALPLTRGGDRTNAIVPLA
jgi:hypothetical protein